jgi:membrane-associated phospholipid phosphatase
LIPTRRSLVLALLVVVLPPAPSRADELSVDVPVTGAVTGGAFAAFGVLELTSSKLTPPTCRWCEPPGLDRNIRLHLRWSDTQLAGTLSNVLIAAVPASLLVTDFALAGRDFNRFGEDALVVLESIAVTVTATDVLKYAIARRRPDAWASGIRSDPGADNAFVSGHASVAFASAAAFGTVAMLRDYQGWPLIYAAGFTGATAVSYLRVAADRHWLTDVAAGAALGTAVGVGVPLLFHRRGHDTDGRSASVVVTPMPLGVAGTF